VAALVPAAYESADLEAITRLLAPDVRWGAPGDPSPPCTTRSQVLAWYRRGAAAGVSARVTESSVVAGRVLVGLDVSAMAGSDGPVERWQVLTARDGLIGEIAGFDARDEAVAWAGGAA